MIYLFLSNSLLLIDNIKILSLLCKSFFKILVQANLFTFIAGAFKHFVALTEVPILSGLIGSGMGYGPALALLLAAPALSFPSVLVIRGILGTKKTLTYIVRVLDENKWKVAKAAEILHTDRANLSRKIWQLGNNVKSQANP